MEDRLDTPVDGNRAQRRAAQRTKKVAALGSGMVLAAAGASTALTLATSAPAGANAPIVVDSLADDGTGTTLREAIDFANGAIGPDTITFQTGLTGTITLTSDLSAVQEALTIQGPGSSALTIDGDGNRIFMFSNIDGTVGADAITGLTITGGDSANGGGILVTGGDADFTLDDVVVTENHTGGDGGGMANISGEGAFVIRNSVFSGNESDGGGGLYFDSGADPTLSSLEIENSSFTGNTAADAGGGLYVNNAALTITNTTITGNHASGSGGGAYIDGSTATITGSVIAGNYADGGGGLWLYGSETTIEFTTISGNHALDGAGGGLYITDDSTDSNTTIRNSTISNNTSQYYGGGLYVNGTGSVAVENSTISGNTATVNGGGAWVSDSAAGFSLTQTTVTNNTALKSYYGPTVGGVLVEGFRFRKLSAGAEARKAARIDAANSKDDNEAKDRGVRGQAVKAATVDPLVLTGTIVAGNVGEDDIGTFGDLSVESDHSILGNVENATQGVVTVTDLGGTQQGVTDPGLDPLADNGGPTQTHALKVGSPAKDAGPNPVPTFPGNDSDQRGAGYPRVVDGTVDVGAYEVQAVQIAPRFTG